MDTVRGDEAVVSRHALILGAAILMVALLTGAFIALMAFGVGGPKTTTAIDDFAEAAAAFLGAAGCVVAAVRHRHDRIAWSLLAGACVAWGAGETVWSYYEVIRGIEVPFPSFADIGFVAEAVLAIAAMLVFKTVKVAGLSRTKMLLDAAAIAAVLASVSLLTVLSSNKTGDTFSQALAQAYPIADIVVITLGVMLIIRAPSNARLTYSLIAVGVLFTALSDSMFAYLTDLGTYATASDVISTGWFTGFLVIGLAGLSDQGLHRPSRPKLPGVLELALPYLCIAAAFVVVSASGFSRNPPSIFARAAIGLALLRLLLTSIQNRRQIRVMDAQLGIIEAHFDGVAAVNLKSRRPAVQFRR